MVFSSLTFLYAYLPISLLIYFFVPRKYRNLSLLFVSLFFYGWGEPKYILVMLLSIYVNWRFGNYINKYRDTNRIKAKKILTWCIVFNLALLGFFKYYDFFVTNLNAVGVSFIKPLRLALPIGISFYTFQTMSYPIDLYRKDCDVQKSLVSFGAYVCMFPQLIAGPIVRYRDIAKELDHRRITKTNFYEGIQRFMVGLSKKVLLANNIGPIFESIASLPIKDTSFVSAWLGIIAYAFQIYFDFSGYSDMAIGLGKMLGFTFLENFNYPYISTSVTDFWRRWHMSLSYWFRDYVYIPLGGNRNGVKRQIFNIMVVWLLTGFWHGASWNFVLWGVFYGLMLLLEKFVLHKHFKNTNNHIKRTYTLFIVLIAWVFFAFTDFKEGFKYLGIMFGSSHTFANGLTTFYLRNNIVLWIACILASTPIAKTRFNFLNNKKYEWMTPVLVFVSLYICTAFIVDASYNPFLYFRF